MWVSLFGGLRSCGSSDDGICEGGTAQFSRRMSDARLSGAPATNTWLGIVVAPMAGMVGATSSQQTC